MQHSIPTLFVEASQNVFISPSLRINSRLGDLWEPAPGEVFLKDLTECLKHISANLGNLPFALRLHPQKKGDGTKLTGAIASKLNDGKLRLFDIDQALAIFAEREVGIGDHDQNAQYVLQDLSENVAILFYLGQGCARIFAGNSLVFEFNPATGGPVGTTHHHMRPCDQYETMIVEHYEQWVKHAQRTNHWHDRDVRTLRNDAPGARFTENIFQISLWQWLNDCFSDKAQARIELRTPESDRTDIEIFPLFSGYFVIEIKWMGKNHNGTNYDEKRIVDGLKQITQYIGRGATVRKATLVMYDGRKEEHFRSITTTEDIAEGVKRLIGNVPDRGSAYVLYLFSKHASES